MGAVIKTLVSATSILQKLMSSKLEKSQEQDDDPTKMQQGS
jgi:hypothetical protein